MQRLFSATASLMNASGCCVLFGTQKEHKDSSRGSERWIGTLETL